MISVLRELPGDEGNRWGHVRLGPTWDASVEYSPADAAEGYSSQHMPRRRRV